SRSHAWSGECWDRSTARRGPIATSRSSWKPTGAGRRPWSSRLSPPFPVARPAASGEADLAPLPAGRGGDGGGRRPLRRGNAGGAVAGGRRVTDVATGGCLCGAGGYQVHGPLRHVLICHCVECRRWHGNFAASTAAARERLALTEQRGLR